MNWYKKAKNKDKLKGGKADNKLPSDFSKKDIEFGKTVEFEHTNDSDVAEEISMDHLEEFENYYDRDVGLPNMERQLEKIEKLKGRKKEKK